MKMTIFNESMHAISLDIPVFEDTKLKFAKNFSGVFNDVCFDDVNNVIVKKFPDGSHKIIQVGGYNLYEGFFIKLY